MGVQDGNFHILYFYPAAVSKIVQNELAGSAVQPSHPIDSSLSPGYELSSQAHSDSWNDVSKEFVLQTHGD